MGLLVATTLPPSFAAQVTGVTVEPGGWVQLAMTTPIVVNIGSGTQLEAKYEDVSSILAGATLQSGDVIDVSVPRAPTVTPRPRVTSVCLTCPNTPRMVESHVA